MHPVPEQAERAREAVAENGGPDMADMHRLGYVGGAEVDDDGAGLGGRLEKEMLTAGGGLERFLQGAGFDPEIEETSAGDLDLLAPLAHVEQGQHRGGELPGIHLPLLRQRHQGRGLVIAELWIGTGPDLDLLEGGVGEREGDGGAQALF